MSAPHQRVYAHDVARYPGRPALRGTDALLCPIVPSRPELVCSPLQKNMSRGRTGYGGGTHPIEAAIYLDLSGEITYDLL